MKTNTLLAILIIGIVLVGACASPSAAPTTSPAATKTPASPAPTTQVVPSTTTSVNATTPAPVATTSKPTLTPVLTPARDLTGTWRGSGAYYYVDKSNGQRVMTVTIDVTMRIVQKNGTVTADMEQRVIKQDPAGKVSVKDASGGERYALLPATDWFGTLRGTASVTNLALATTSTIGYTDRWTFTFTTDLMSGGVITQMTGNVLYECKSDPKAFELVRQKID